MLHAVPIIKTVGSKKLFHISESFLDAFQQFVQNPFASANVTLYEIQTATETAMNRGTYTSNITKNAQ